MTLDEFKAIIVDAILREIEAAKFYHELQKSMKIDASKVILQELENMEWGHKHILENFQNEGLDDYVPPKIENIKLAEMLADIAETPNMTIQEIVILAIKREESAWKLYKLLADESPNEKTRNLFLKLATEEAKHKHQLESLYEKEFMYEN